MSTVKIRSLAKYRALKSQVIKDMAALNADDAAVKKAVLKAFKLFRAGHDMFYSIKMATREHTFAAINTRGPGAA